MNKKLNSATSVPIVPLKELNLSARFLFDEVMEDPQTQQEICSDTGNIGIPLFRCAKKSESANWRMGWFGFS